MIIYFDAEGKDLDALEDLAFAIEAKSTKICDGCGEAKPHTGKCHKRSRNPVEMREWALEQLRRTI